MKHKFISRILTIVLSVVAVSGLASCGTKKIEYIDDQSVRLNLDYKGKDFYKDGVAEVTLKTCIDGDTAHFSPIAGSSNMDTIKSRFFGIDTPESTGKVEPYGKAASNFTKEKLKTASEKGTIVVSSAQDYYGKPNPDSTGERYVTLIWVCLDKKNADVEDLRLLNLWLVQEGYSYVKNVEAMPQYAEIFDKAEAQAECVLPEEDGGYYAEIREQNGTLYLTEGKTAEDRMRLLCIGADKKSEMILENMCAHTFVFMKNGFAVAKVDEEGNRLAVLLSEEGQTVAEVSLGQNPCMMLSCGEKIYVDSGFGLSEETRMLYALNEDGKELGKIAVPDDYGYMLGADHDGVYYWETVEQLKLVRIEPK